MSLAQPLSMQVERPFDSQPIMIQSENEARHIPLSQELKCILDQRSGVEKVTLNWLLERTEGRSVFLIMIMLCLPYVIPNPIPGMSTILGGTIMLLAFGLMSPRKFRLPAKLGDRQLPDRIVQLLSTRGIGFLRWLEGTVRPRHEERMENRAFRSINILALIWAAFLLALPLPVPFTNTLPAYAIILTAVSMMEQDGKMVWLGHLANLLTSVYFFFIADEASHVVVSCFTKLMHLAHGAS